MSHRQILLPPPTVEDGMDDVALTPYNRPEFAFNFEVWQEAPQRGLPSLLPRLPPSVATAPSTDSSSEAVIHSVPLQFQPQRRKGKPLYEVKDPAPASQNSRVSGHNYNNYSKKKKRPLHRSRNSRTNRQSTQGCSNALLPMCRIQLTPAQHIRHSCPVASAINWITLPRS